MDNPNQFGAADLAVFGGMLAISTFIGIYYAFKDKKSNSTENYNFGGRKMSVIPIALSMSVTFVSSVTVLAFPAHAYVYGTVAMWFPISTIIQVVIARAYYIPLYHRLQLSSVYEYLELRYNRKIRQIASVMVIALLVSYMATTLYVTAMALSAVTPINLTVSLVLTSVICTGYTTLGGMKAVVWNDTIQSVIMATGMIALMVKSIKSVGGIDQVWESIYRGGRHTFWRFDLDPTEQQTFWTIMVGNGIIWTCTMCVNQAIVQRYQSCAHARDAKLASLLALIPIVLMKLVALVTGCAMYAYFEGCDPVESGQLDKADQAVAYLAVILFQSAPGMAGLFVAAAYCGMLSTVSSGINSLAVLVLEDMIVPCIPHLNAKRQLRVSKGLNVLFGSLVMIFAFLLKYMSGTILQIASTLFGIFGGPILAMYVIGIHFPWTNNYGAGCGLISGVMFSLWIAIGGILYPPENNGSLPMSIDNCSSIIDYTSNFANTSSVQPTTQAITSAYNYESERPVVATKLYSLSFLYIGNLGMCVTILVAALTTLVTDKRNPKDMDPSLFVPLLDSRVLPIRIRRFFRFGVPQCKANMFVCGKEEEMLRKSQEDKDYFEEQHL